MNRSDLESLVNLVTQQVLAAMGGEDPVPAAGTEGRTKVLVLGDPNAALPPELSTNAVLYYLEDYQQHQNILRYDCLVLTALNTTQLADLALVRVSDDLTCAVVQALLNGIDTYLLETALTFRKYAGKGSTALYRTLENYARTLQVYGVKPFGAQPVQTAPGEVRPPKYKAPPIQVPTGTGTPTAGRLITETQARQLLEQGGPIHLPAGAIVTPLARDLFSHAGAELIRDL